MTTYPKPRVDLRPPADAYSGPAERIIEFSDRVTGAGGLISIRRQGDDLVVDVYRCDLNVRVLARQAEDATGGVLPEGTTCGIHGDSTESGRCPSCDAERAVEAINDSGVLPDGVEARYDSTPLLPPAPTITEEDRREFVREAGFGLVGRYPQELDEVYEPELPMDPTGVDCAERYESPSDQA